MRDSNENGLETALSHVGVDMLKLESSKYPSPEVYVTMLDSRFRTSAIYRLMQGAALSIEPEDRVTGANASISKAKAFLIGELIAARVVHEFMNADQKRKILRLSIGVEDTEESDTAHALHLQAEEIIDCSERGYEAAGAYHELLEEWEDRLCPTVADQRFYHRGFGFMMYRMQEVYRMQQEEELEQRLRDGINWDAVVAGWASDITDEKE